MLYDIVYKIPRSFKDCADSESSPEAFREWGRDDDKASCVVQVVQSGPSHLRLAPRTILAFATWTGGLAEVFVHTTLAMDLNRAFSCIRNWAQTLSFIKVERTACRLALSQG